MKEFISHKFLSCPDTAKWHIIKIPAAEDHNLVVDNLDDELREVKICRDEFLDPQMLEQLATKELSQTRQNDLSFF